MKKELVGKVLKLYLSKKEGRECTNSILLDDGGVINDKFYNKDIQRSVLLSSMYSYDLAQDNSIDIEYGKLGENILLDYNPYNLEIGTQLQIGKAIVEISQPCTLCKGLSSLDSRLPKLLKQDRGVFSKVINKGIIKDNDQVYLIK